MNLSQYEKQILEVLARESLDIEEMYIRLNKQLTIPMIRTFITRLVRLGCITTVCGDRYSAVKL